MPAASTTPMTGLVAWKDYVDIIKSGVETLAILLGGGWAVWRFWIRRERHPKADIRHDVECFQLSKGQYLVHVAIIVKNVGSVLMEPTLLIVRLLQVLPLDDEMQDRLVSGKALVRSDTRRGDWAGIGEHELKWPAHEIRIEPGESHVFVFDFHVDCDIDAFQVYSYLQNPKATKKDLGWEDTTMHKPTRPEQPDPAVRQGPCQPTPRVPAQTPRSPAPRKPAPRPPEPEPPKK